MTAPRTYYDILQVQPTAQQEVIDAAYRGLAKKYHPDVNSEPNAGLMMQEINVAYAVLKDPDKRREYDREIGLSSSGSSQAARTPASENSQRQSQPAPSPRPNTTQVDCPYFFGDYYRGRDIEKCRLIERNHENTRPWRRALCDSCPVPGILRNTTCKHLALEASVVRKFLVSDRAEVYAICTEHVAELKAPNHCPQCEAENNR